MPTVIAWGMANSSHTRVCLRCSALVLGIVASLAPPRQAQAAPVFGGPATFFVGAEDVTGFFSRSEKYWYPNNYSERSRSDFALAFATGGVRLGLHYFVIQGLSLGGTLGYESISGSNTMPDGGGTWTYDVVTDSHLVFMPKVGYALMFTDKVGLWFRGGLGYERDKQRAGDQAQYNYTRASYFMASADIFFVWSPVPHFGVLIGPTFENSLIGSHLDHDRENGDYSNDARLRRIGVTSGLGGYF